MAKNKKNKTSDRLRRQGSDKRKVVVTTSEEQQSKAKPKLKPTSARSRAVSSGEPQEMLFGKENFILLAAGAALVFIGLLLMSGGHQPDNQWNPDEIYSIRRTYLAPVVILLGLVTVLVSIFKKKKGQDLA